MGERAAEGPEKQAFRSLVLIIVCILKTLAQAYRHPGVDSIYSSKTQRTMHAWNAATRRQEYSSVDSVSRSAVAFFRALVDRRLTIRSFQI